MYKFFILVVAIVACSCSAQDATQKDIGDFCPKTNYEGKKTYLLPHANCHKYYVCNDGKAIEFTCANNQEYNPKTKVCGFPAGNCKPVPEKIQLKCSKNPEVYFHFSHISDCDKFYKCNHGEMVEFSCPKGQHFIPAFNLCGHPAGDCKLLQV